MKTVRPKPIAELSALELTPEEGFVLSRIDGRLSVRELVALTGIEHARIEQIVTKLAARGALSLDGANPSPDGLTTPGTSPAARDLAPDGAGTSLADFAAALGMGPAAFAAPKAPGAPEVREPPAPPARVEHGTARPPPPLDELIEVPDEGEPPEATPPAEGEAESEAPAADETPQREADERTYRALYEQRWRKRTVDERVAAAGSAEAADLQALCFDVDPRVVGAVLENAAHGLEHVRLLAMHHPTATGLELVTRRQDRLRDAMVERRLLRNPHAGEIVLGRVMGPKRVLPTYKIAIDRDVPELTRVKARGLFRQKWQSAAPEERADLVLRTEGRCLVLMTGCTFDAKTTQILCGRPFNNVLFIQNVAKWPATPPGLLAHLFKQPFVRKSPPLKRLLLQHPNLPGEVKRQL